MPRRSLMRALAARGLAPFLVDWDAPGAAERGFSLDDYVAGRLEGALDRVTAATGRPAAVLGYCMGGLLALALAGRRPEAVARLVLLACPWDFHAARPQHAACLAALAEPLGRLIERLGELPVDLLQALFMTLDPGGTARRYAAFAGMQPASARARAFVALEDWANDGVPLAGPVARACLFGWYGANEPARGAWTIAGQAVDPGRVGAPTLLVIPARDRIVPPEAARPLAARLPDARVVTARGGHVGMLLSARAGSELYSPLAKWIGGSAAQWTGCARPEPRRMTR
jgi:polyhydroxyalkanoate synthase